MSRLVWFSVVTLSLGAGLANEGAAQTKAAAKKGGDILVATPQQYALLAQYKEMVGVVKSTSPGMLTLRVQHDHPVKNATGTTPSTTNNNSQQQMQHLQQQLQAAARIKNPIQAQQQVAQIQGQMYQLQAQQSQQKMNQSLKSQSMGKDYIDFELPLLETASIRKMEIGIEYDAKGNLKDFAPPVKEKGMIGYAAKFEDLSNGAEVKVYLAAPKSTATPAKKDASGAAIDAVPANRPRVRMVVIFKDATGDAMPNKKK